MQASGKGVSIIEVAERCQDPKAAGPNIRPSSPRTAEAFLRSGFDPEDLVYKPVSFFKAKTGDDETAQTAFQFYESSRTGRIDELRALRQSLIDDGWKPTDIAKPSAAAATVQGEGAEDLVEREQKRLEVLRNRYALPPTLRRGAVHSSLVSRGTLEHVGNIEVAGGNACELGLGERGGGFEGGFVSEDIVKKHLGKEQFAVDGDA